MRITFITLLYLLSLRSISQPEVPTGRRLKEIAADKFTFGNVYIGGASSYNKWDSYSQIILNREFNFIIPNNDFKQTVIHPEPGSWRWERPDGWIDSAKKNHQIIRMHSPISPQASKWAKDDSRTGAELEQNMTEYMTELCKRYNNVEEVVWMDVVNETVERDGNWFGPKAGTDKWENPWTIVGFDETDDGLNPPAYIRKAFEIANEYAPNIKLIYNQHGDMEDAMWDKVKATVLYLKSLGLRVDGIGWQAHLETDFLDDPNHIPKLKALIDWAHENDLEFHVTENDVDILDGDDEDDQALVFAAVVKAVVEKGINGVVAWNTWMIRESDGQGADGRPTLFYDNGSAKPAYYSVQQVLEEVNHTASLKIETIGLGSVNYSDTNFLRNTKISLEALPDSGYVFSSWIDDIESTENPLIVTMDRDFSLRAIFKSQNSNETILHTDDYTTEIYPNPVEDGVLNISGITDSTFIRLFDEFGRLLEQKTLVPSTPNSPTSFYTNQKPGIYFLEITQNQTITTKKIIIK